MIARALILFVLAHAASGQSVEVERFLVPIYLEGPASGAFGSRWVSELRILNEGPEDAILENYGIDCGGPSLCLPEPIPPFVSAPGDRLRTSVLGPIPSVLLLAHRETADQWVFTSRVRDTSREADGWGTWLPVIHESQVRHRIDLLDIPVDPAYRHTLRIYSFDLAPGRSVRVRVYQARDFPAAIPPEPDTLLGEMTLPLRHESDAKPLYAELGELPTIGTAADRSRVRVTVEPVGSFGVWAMVSVTNNVTQQVTMILPQAVR